MWDMCDREDDTEEEPVLDSVVLADVVVVLLLLDLLELNDDDDWEREREAEPVAEEVDESECSGGDEDT